MISEKQNKATILIVDDIPDNIGVLLDFLMDKNFRVLVAEDGESAIEQVMFLKPDLILLDVMMPGIDGFETCRRLKENNLTSDVPVIFMTALSDLDDKVRGFNSGAVDYITKPIQHEEVLARINTHLSLQQLREELKQTNDELENRVKQRTNELLEMNNRLEAEIIERIKAETKLTQTVQELELLKNKLQEENIYLKQEIKIQHNFEEIISQSPQLSEVLKKLEQVAKTDSTVLVLGETGTGKELIARAVHNISLRRKQPLVKVNCAALPANLIESELFGHEKGAFTGAISKKIGRFELANNGTIFLDEIGDLPLELQSKLLRVLQEGEFERLGSSQTIKVDVRIIAATNRKLEEEVKKGDFREDLYYRLNVFPLNLPPLRERDSDIPLLVNHFISKYSKKIGREILKVPIQIMDALKRYTWPGNVRELENVIERAVILSENGILNVDDRFINTDFNTEDDENSQTMQEIEKAHIIKALDDCNYIIEGKRGAAKKLGMPPSTLRDRMKKYNISKPTK
jgi:chemotaxis protein methyltransferase CheR